MTFHGATIAVGHYSVAMTSIKKRFMKLPFPTTKAIKVKDIVNGVVLWQEKDLRVYN
jgi:hypothetical protein